MFDYLVLNVSVCVRVCVYRNPPCCSTSRLLSDSAAPQRLLTRTSQLFVLHNWLLPPLLSESRVFLPVAVKPKTKQSIIHWNPHKQPDSAAAAQRHQTLPAEEARRRLSLVFLVAIVIRMEPRIRISYHHKMSRRVLQQILKLHCCPRLTHARSLFHF